MKGFHLALRLAQFGRGGETLTYCLAADLAGEAEVRAMAELARVVAVAGGFSAATLDGRDGAAAKIAQLKNPHQNGGPLLFKGAKGVRQGRLLSERIITLGL